MPATTMTTSLVEAVLDVEHPVQAGHADIRHRVTSAPYVEAVTAASSATGGSGPSAHDGDRAEPGRSRSAPSTTRRDSLVMDRVEERLEEGAGGLRGSRVARTGDEDRSTSAAIPTTSAVVLPSE